MGHTPQAPDSDDLFCSSSYRCVEGAIDSLAESDRRDNRDWRSFQWAAAASVPARPHDNQGRSPSDRPAHCASQIITHARKIKRGWSPIPAFSHREPPFCVAAECYLFLAPPFLAPPFLAPPLAPPFLAPPFLLVAIACASPFLKICHPPHTRCCVSTTLVY